MKHLKDFSLLGIYWHSHLNPLTMAAPAKLYQCQCFSQGNYNHNDIYLCWIYHKECAKVNGLIKKEPRSGNSKRLKENITSVF